jgi:hypothetical protein
VIVAAGPTPTDRRVRVWFGEHVIADYRAEGSTADRYAELMGQRFAGLRITNEPLPLGGPPTDPLPGERMWDVPPK